MFDGFERYWSPVKPPWPGCPRTKDGRRWNIYVPVPEQPMNESEFDPRAALGRMAGAAPTEPPAAGGVTDPPPPAPAHAETREQRRSAALELVARYREDHPGDPRTDDQLLVAPYGGYELLIHEPGARAACMERLASLRPAPAEEPRP